MDMRLLTKIIELNSEFLLLRDGELWQIISLYNGRLSVKRVRLKEIEDEK